MRQFQKPEPSNLKDRISAVFLNVGSPKAWIERNSCCKVHLYPTTMPMHRSLPPLSRKIVFLSSSLFLFQQETLGALPLAFNDATIELFDDMNPGEADSFHEFAIVSREDGMEGGLPLALFSATTIVEDGSGQENLYITDGTKQGITMLLPNAAVEGIFKEYNGAYYFSRYIESEFAFELWKTSGTPETTQLALNKQFSAEPEEFLIFDDELYFQAGFQIWKTDGTVSGTSMLVDFARDPVIGNETDLRVRDLAGFDDFLLITIEFSILGVNGEYLGGNGVLVRTDGSSEGTTILTNIPYPRLAREFRNAIVNDKILVRADDGLWITDGSSTGTQRIYDDQDGVRSISTHVINGRGFFYTNFRTVLLTTDGTSEGTIALNITNPSATNISYVDFPGSGRVSSFDGSLRFGPKLNGKVSLFADGVGPGIAGALFVWVTSGTGENTELIRAIPGAEPFFAVLLADGRFVFRVHIFNEDKEQLWITDGTEDGTFLVVEFGTYDSNNAASRSIVDIGSSTLLVAGSSSETGYELWKVRVPPPIPPVVETTAQTPVSDPTASPRSGPLVESGCNAVGSIATTWLSATFFLLCAVQLCL